MGCSTSTRGTTRSWPASSAGSHRHRRSPMAGDPFAVFARGGKISFGKFNELCDVIEQAEQLGKPSTSSGGDHKLAPRSIEEYIGQDRLKARISVHVASARARHEP